MTSPRESIGTLHSHVHRLTHDKQPVKAFEHPAFQPFINEPGIDSQQVVARRHEIPRLLTSTVKRHVLLENITDEGRALLRQRGDDIRGGIGLHIEQAVPPHAEPSYVQMAAFLYGQRDIEPDLVFSHTLPDPELLTEAEKELHEWGLQLMPVSTDRGIEVSAVILPNVVELLNERLAELE